MTNSPNPDNETERSANRRVWLLWLSRAGLSFGVILLVGIAAGAWWAWVFVNRELAPLVERNLSQTFQRPVQLGRVERFGLNGLRFGASAIPATATDADRASVQAVEVGFNPLQLLLSRTLELDLTLINPDVYIQQDPDGRWINTQVKVAEGQGPIKTVLNSVRADNAKVVLLPLPKPGNARVPVAIAPLSGNVQIFDNNQRLRFDVQGQLASNQGANVPVPNTAPASFKTSGEYLLSAQQANLQLQAQSFPVVEIDRLIQLPIADLKAGRVSGNLNIRYRARELPVVQGMASLEQIALTSRQLPVPVTNLNGMVGFTGQGVNLNNVTTFLGQIPVQASGSADLQSGLNLNVNVPSVAIATVTQTFNLKPPRPVSGEVGLATKITGTVQEPLILGEVSTTKPTQVDRLNFNRIKSQFALSPKTNELIVSNIQILPAAGGTIVGKGKINLGQQSDIVIDLQGQNLPADAIAQIYGAQLPPNIKIGNLSTQTQIFGPLKDIRIVSRFQAPQATYPTAGEVAIAGRDIVLRNTTISVPNGTVQASGRIEGSSWQANVQTTQLPVSSILAIAPSTNQQKPQEIPAPVQQAIISGSANLSGTVNSFKPEDIRATAQANVQIAGGNVQVRDARLTRGNWRASVNASGIELERFPQVPPQFRSTFNGAFAVTGNINATQATNIQAVGRGRLNIAGGNVEILQAGLRNNAWEATVRANGVNLGQLAKVPPELQTPFNGQFLLAGNLGDAGTGSIKAVGNGRIQLAGGNVNLRQVELAQGNFRATIAASGVQLARLPQVPKNLQAGAFNGEFQVAGNLDNLTNNKEQSPLTQINVSGQGNLQIAGGNVQLRQVELAGGNWQALVDTNNVQLSRFPQVQPQLQGAFSGQLQASGKIDTFTQESASPLSEIQANARGTLRIASGTVQLKQARLNNGDFQALIGLNNLQLARFPQVPKELQGTFNGELQAVGNINTLTQKTDSPLSQIQANISGNLQIGSGTVQLRQVNLNRGNFQATIATNNLQLERFPQVPRQLRGTFTGQVEAAGNINTFTQKSASPLSEIQANASGTLRIAGDGTVQISRAQLSQGNWQVALDANRIQLSRFPQVPAQFQGIFTGQLQASGNVDIFTRKTDELPLNEIQANGRGTLQTAGGTINIQEAQVANGRWAAAVNLAQVQLNRFSQQLQGRLSGDLKVGGSLATLTRKDASPLSDIQADGNLNFTQTPYLNRPLNVSFLWNGQQLQIRQATAPGLDVNGVIAANFNRNNQPEITDINLNVRAEDFNLQTLPVTLPRNLVVVGLVDFNGQITGRPNALNANGDLQLQNLVVGEFKFDPVLRGNVQAVAGRGVRLQLQGDRDQIALELNQNYRPETFLLRRGEIVAQGRREGELFLLNVANLPVATLKEVARGFVNLPPEIAVQPVNGQLSGDLAINFDTLNVERGNIAIAKPSIGELNADSLTANFRYISGRLEILSSELRKDESIYALSGNISELGPNARVQGKLNIEKGKVQNVLAALDWFNLRGIGRGGRQNFGRGINVPTTAVGIPQASLWTQLQRYSEINALLRQQRDRRQQASPIPDISELQGNFNGSVEFAGRLPTSIQANFNINGDNWQLGQYRANRVLAQGTYQNNNLTVQALRVESGETLVAFNGTLGLQQQNGQLLIQNFPIDALENFVELPVALTGKLNGTVDIAGNLENPQATGLFSLVGATVNGTPVQSAQADFSYVNARLDFKSQVLVNPPQPILISGSVPFKLPFAKVSPDSDSISLDVNVQNEGLALLNLLTRQQIQWVSGTGQVQLQVRGTLERPIPTGVATLQDATLGGQYLPEPLKNLTGVVQFSGDRITVQNLAGNFTDGQIAAKGTIPIFRRLDSQDPDRANPLTVSLDRARVNLKGLYQGAVNGNVVIGGAVVNPRIGGEVDLLEGQLLLPSANTTGGGGGQQTTATPLTPAIEFRNFQIVLRDKVNITQQPILSFRGSGTLTLNGSLDAPSPEGTINLKRGSVNLFAVRFRLDRSTENTAVFVPSQGFDPTLDVRLLATVPEVTQTRLPASANASEINDTPATDFGTLQSIRVEATVQGRASQLQQNLQLTSNPPRSETEIVALIGGGFINSLGASGGEGLTGLATVAGSVILPGLEGVFGDFADRLGLSEFRIYPTLVTQGKEANSSVLGLAAEVGVDITRNLSASVLRILTADQPTQFGLRYRLNNEFTVRGSTDFSGDSRAVLEFQRRF